MSSTVKIKRAYEDADEQDGYRVLVDRLWPRGISRTVLHTDEWAKGLAPSPALRKWFGHKPERWEVFQTRYLAELKENEAVQEFVNTHKKHRVITLVYAAKDKAITHALVLQELLQKKFNKKST